MQFESEVGDGGTNIQKWKCSGRTGHRFSHPFTFYIR